MWYDYDTSNNKFYILTGKDSKKVNNLKGNDIIYFCVDDPNPPYKGVRGKGIVKAHENVNFNVPIAQKIAYRYIGTLDHPISYELVERLKNGQEFSQKLVQYITQLGLKANCNLNIPYEYSHGFLAFLFLLFTIYNLEYISNTIFF